MNWSVETLFIVHIAVISVVLAAVARLLWRRGLFNWKGAGFWAWASFALYFILNPYFALQNGELYLYRLNLALAGGVERGVWILLVLVLGVVTFFGVYLRARPATITWRLQGDTLSLPMLACAALFGAFGLYSLLSFRAGVIDIGGALSVESGRFTGDVTGYDSIGYMFLVVPSLILVFSQSQLVRTVGWLMAGLFILLALPTGWARYALISMVIAVSLADVVRRKAVWPRWFFVPLLLLFTLSLQLRGHTEWTLESSGGDLAELSSQVVQNLDRSIGNAVSSEEVSALATWYLESYVVENYSGYSYGLPLLNYALTGWIPGRFFPQKYFLIDWLQSQKLYTHPLLEDQLYGAKSTLLGSFYYEGGLIGVILLSAVAGFLSRKLDGMLDPRAPLLVRATGAAWMSLLWMIWQSSDTWAVVVLGTLAIPALAMWFFAPKMPRASSKPLSAVNR